MMQKSQTGTDEGMKVHKPKHRRAIHHRQRRHLGYTLHFLG